MKIYQPIKLLAGLVMLIGVIALQMPVETSAAENDPNAVTLTPSLTPTNTEEPTDTPEPTATNTSWPTATEEGTLPNVSPTATNTLDPTNIGTAVASATSTTAPNTPVPTYRPNPGGRGNLGIVGFWAFVGGFLAIFMLWLVIPLVRGDGTKPSAPAENTTAAKAFSPGIFYRKWIVLLFILMALGTIIGYAIVNFS